MKNIAQLNVHSTNHDPARNSLHYIKFPAEFIFQILQR